MVALIVLVVSIIGLALFAWWVAGGDPLGGSDAMEIMKSFERHPFDDEPDFTTDPIYSILEGNICHNDHYD